MTTCGSYELLDIVGAGTSGTVYRARPAGPESSSETVAVKVLSHTPRDPWLSHLETLARSPNPHVCRFYEQGLNEEKQIYVVYQFLEGDDLEQARQRFDEHRVPLRQALRWTIDVLKGLENLHLNNFIHGDIKPSNLMLNKDQGVVICDFTTLTALQGPLSTDLHSGTPEYLPPQEADLRSPRRDLYALTVTLFGLLTGQLPPKDEPAVPSKWDPLLPSAVDDIVARGLSPETPFGSAGEMRQVLEQLLTGPTPAPAMSSLSPPTRRVDLQKVRSQNPLWPWLIALAMLPVGLWLHSVLAPVPPARITSTALWSGIGVRPQVVDRQLAWVVCILSRPTVAFVGEDHAWGKETAEERARWCAAVLEEAHFQKRPLEFSYRRELEQSCEVWLVGDRWEEKRLFRITASESKLFERKAPLLARYWCQLIQDTAELARPGSRGGSEKGPGALALVGWERRYETLSVDRPPTDQPDRIKLWLEAFFSLGDSTRNDLLESFQNPPKEADSGD